MGLMDSNFSIKNIDSIQFFDKLSGELILNCTPISSTITLSDKLEESKQPTLTQEEINQAMIRTSQKIGCSAKEAGEAFKRINKTLQHYQNKKEDTFLNYLKQIENETEETINGIYGE